MIDEFQSCSAYWKSFITVVLIIFLLSILFPFLRDYFVICTVNYAEIGSLVVNACEISTLFIKRWLKFFFCETYLQKRFKSHTIMLECSRYTKIENIFTSWDRFQLFPLLNCIQNDKFAIEVFRMYSIFGNLASAVECWLLLLSGSSIIWI